MTIRVRHSTFSKHEGTAVRETVKRDRLQDIEYPATFVKWDDPFTPLESIIANYNLVFIVPAGRRVI